MFNLQSKYKPTGDQPQAIEYLSKGIKEGKKFQTLLGVTGSRKNFYNGKHNSYFQRAMWVTSYRSTTIINRKHISLHRIHI